MQNGHVRVVRELVQYNLGWLDAWLDAVDPEVQRRTDGATALMLASLNGHEEVVHELLEDEQVGVNLRRRSDGATAFVLACSKGQRKLSARYPNTRKWILIFDVDRMAQPP